MNPAYEALARYRGAVLREMRAVVDSYNGPLYDLQRYHLGWLDASGNPLDATGGKMFRPALLLLCCEALGGDVERALPAAAAVELLHNFSLIHDDIEDGSQTRHGRRTLWTIWGLPRGVNAGDSMFVLARLALHRLGDRGYAPERVLAAFRIFDDASRRLCEGQDADLRFEACTAVPLDDYLAMIAGKTGALITASAELGALLAEAPDDLCALFRRFGQLLGRAFQIRDDILGIWGVEEQTGKSSGDDIRARKKAYPFVRAVEKADTTSRAALLELYAQPDPEGTTVRQTLALFDRLDVRADAERAACQAADEALSLLESAPLREPARAELIALTRFVATREA